MLFQIKTQLNWLKQSITRNRASMATFLIVGGISALINFGSFAVLWNGLGVHYQVAVSIAYVLSLLFHFSANRRFTFKRHGVHFFYQIPKYLTMIMLNYIITLVVVYCAVEVLHLSPYLGIVFSIGITVNVGYLMSRLWVFKAVNS